VAFWVFVEACNKGVGEDPVRIPMIDVGVIRWRYTLALYDRACASFGEFREALSLSPIRRRGVLTCITDKPRSDAPSVVLPCGMCALYPADTAKLNKQ